MVSAKGSSTNLSSLLAVPSIILSGSQSSTTLYCDLRAINVRRRSNSLPSSTYIWGWALILSIASSHLSKSIYGFSVINARKSSTWSSDIVGFPDFFTTGKLKTVSMWLNALCCRHAGHRPQLSPSAVLFWQCMNCANALASMNLPAPEGPSSSSACGMRPLRAMSRRRSFTSSCPGMSANLIFSVR